MPKPFRSRKEDTFPRDDKGRIIWGKLTNAACIDYCVEFISNFRPVIGTEKTRKYLDSLRTIRTRPGENWLEIDMIDLQRFDDSFLFLVQRDAERFFKCMREACLNLLRELDHEFHNNLNGLFRIRLAGMEFNTKKIIELSNQDLNSVVVIEGKISQLDPRAKDLLIMPVWMCNNEDSHPTEYTWNVKPGFEKPRKCPGCDSKAIQIAKDKSKYERQQFIKIIQQEVGTIAQEIWVELRDSYCNLYQHNDVLRIAGVVKAHLEGEDENPVNKSTQVAMSLYLTASRVDVIEDKRMVVSLTEKDITEIREWRDQVIASGGKPTLRAELVKSFAPDISGNDQAKYAVMATGVSGNLYTRAQNVKKRKRKWLTLLLFGPISGGKSQIVFALADLVPAIYAGEEGVGKGSGLGAQQRYDERLKRVIVDGGFGASGNNMVKILDEINNLDADMLNDLPTMLENGFYPLMRGNQTEPVPTVGPWIGVMNPKGRVYDTTESLQKNLGLKESIISRFDMVLYVPEITDPAEVEKVLDGMVDEFEGRDIPVSVNSDKLRKYLTYAKTLNPVFEPGVTDRLKKYYMGLRQLQAIQNHQTVIVFRQFIGMLRFARANAMLMLDSKITMDDAEETIKMFDWILATVGVDTKTHTMTFPGMTNEEAGKSMKRVFNEILSEFEKRESFMISSLKKELMNTHAFDQNDAEEYVSRAIKEGRIYNVFGVEYRVAPQ